MLDPSWNVTLLQNFGFDRLRPIQESVVARLAAAESALVVLPTGAGKSLCFQLPALHRGPGSTLPAQGLTLVFSPLIALMEDQVATLRRLDVAATFVNSTLGRQEREERYGGIARGAFDLVYVTPERMEKPDFVDALRRTPGGVRLLVVDEAHCIAEWGHDFRPAYRQIGVFRETLGSPVTLAATATATQRVRDEIRAVLGMDSDRMPLFSTGVDRPNLHYATFDVWGESEKIDVTRQIAGASRGTGVIYFSLIRSIESIASDLSRALPDRSVEIYHGQLDPREKRRVQRRFDEARPDDGLILVATNAFGMGVDKRDIRWVLHGEIPGSIEAYAQETGRAGRDGEPSICALLFDPADVAIQEQFVEWANPGNELIESAINELAVAPHGELDLEELRSRLFGRRMDRRAEACVLELERVGAVKTSDQDSIVRFVQRPAIGVIDPEWLVEKKRRDQQRLLSMVQLARSEDIRGDLNAYFEL